MNDYLNGQEKVNNYLEGGGEAVISDYQCGYCYDWYHIWLKLKIKLFLFWHSYDPLLLLGIKVT